MAIVTSKKSSRKRKNTKATPEQKFDRAWQRVQNQQQRNVRFREEIQVFVKSVENRIGDHERRYVDGLYRCCEHLIGFYPRKSLTRWQRETLLEWFLDYVTTLTTHPFSEHLEIGELQKKCLAAIEAIHPPEPEPSPAARAEPEKPPMDDMFEELFADFADNSGDDDEDADSFDADNPFEEFFREQQSREEQRLQQTRELNTLLKSSSINGLFRKITRVLHPDREQDDDARKHKNHLMSELIEARDKNDIARILSFYTEYVGESPLAELEGDLETATQLLQQQYEDLRDREQDILDEDPRTAVIYERFYHRSEHRVRQAIGAHLAELEKLIANQTLLITEVTSLKILKPLLEDRFEMGLMGDPLIERATEFSHRFAYG